jgi:hypothetical protein
MLAADVALGILPFVPAGVGWLDEGFKLANRFDDAIDLGKTLDKGLDVTKHLDDIPRATRTLDKTRDITETTAKTLSRLDEGLDAERTVLHHTVPSEIPKKLP